MRRAGAQAFHGHSAPTVVQGGDEPAQRRQRVRHWPAVTAAVHGMIERANLDQYVDDAAQRRGQRWLSDSPVRTVYQHNGVGSQQLLVLTQKLRQVPRPDLLFTLDEDRHADRWL